MNETQCFLAKIQCDAEMRWLYKFALKYLVANARTTLKYLFNYYKFSLVDLFDQKICRLKSQLQRVKFLNSFSIHAEVRAVENWQTNFKKNPCDTKAVRFEHAINSRN